VLEEFTDCRYKFYQQFLTCAILFHCILVAITLWSISKVYWIDKVGNRRAAICDRIPLLINYQIQVRVHQSESRHERWMHKLNHTPLLHIEFPMFCVQNCCPLQWPYRWIWTNMCVNYWELEHKFNECQTILI